MDEESKGSSSQHPLNDSDLARNIKLLAEDDGALRTDLPLILGDELREAWCIENGDDLTTVRRKVIANLESHFLNLVHPPKTSRAKFIRVVRVMFNMHDGLPADRRVEYHRRMFLTKGKKPESTLDVVEKTIWNHVNRACNQIQESITDKTHQAVLIDVPETERQASRTVAIVSNTEEVSPTSTKSDKGNLPPLTRHPLPRRATADPEILNASRKLADEVQIRGNREWRFRKIGDPFPLPVHWTYGPQHLSDRRENIRASANDTDEVSLGGNISQVLGFFDAIPSHRLVALGRAGAGKSILALEFVLNFLASEERRATSLVPVIFSLASWNPTQLSLRDWMAEQLIATYPFLGQRAKSKRTLAAELTRHDLILPVLDGLDEMSLYLWPEALRAINSSLNDDTPLILTSRPDEYASAVEDDEGYVLTRTAVIQLEDLTVDDLLTYLPRSTNPAKETEAQNKWLPVLDRLQNNQDDPAAATLLSVLSTPLMVSLARTVYSDTSADPAELLNTEEFSDATAVSNHLLDSLIPAVYDHPPQDEEIEAVPGRKKPPQWSADDARRWLEALALRAQSRGRRSITQWDEISKVCDLIIFGILGIASVLSAVSVFFFDRNAGYLDTATCGLFIGFSSIFVYRGYKNYGDIDFLKGIAGVLFAARTCIVVALCGAMWQVGTVWGWIGLSLLLSFFLVSMTSIGSSAGYYNLSKFADPHSVLREIRVSAVVWELGYGIIFFSAPILLCWVFYGQPEVAIPVALTIIPGSILGFLLVSRN